MDSQKTVVLGPGRSAFSAEVAKLMERERGAESIAVVDGDKTGLLSVLPFLGMAAGILGPEAIERLVQVPRWRSTNKPHQGARERERRRRQIERNATKAALKGDER